MIIDPTEDFIEKNYAKLTDFVKTQVKDTERQTALLNLLETLGDRFALAPASGRAEYHSAFPGGLVYHTLHVLQWAGKFAGVMAPGKYSNETLLTVALLHDIGKVGDLENDYYTPNNSAWHNERGMFYEFNPKCSSMRIPARSLFLAQHFGVKLTQEECQAILFSDSGQEETAPGAKFRETKLSHILRNADMWATILEKENDVRY